MRRVIFTTALVGILIGLAPQAQAYLSQNASEYAAVYARDDIILYGMLAQGSTWNDLPAYESSITTGYRCHDPQYDLWKTVADHVIRGQKLLVAVHLSCGSAEGYCAAPDFGKRTQLAVYADCRPLTLNPRAFSCRIPLREVPALCELNDNSAMKLMRLAADDGFRMQVSVLAGKNYPARSPELDTYAIRSPVFQVGSLLIQPLSDADGDSVPDPWDNCPNKANAGQEDSDGNGVGDGCQPPAALPATVNSAPTSVTVGVAREVVP